MLTITVNSNDANQTLLSFLKKFLTNYVSLSQIYKLIRTKQIKINNHRINDQKILLHLNDIIVIYINLNNWKTNNIAIKKLNNVDIKIISENEDFLIVYKPKNIIVHSNDANCFDNQVINYLIETKQYNPEKENSFKPCHIHRLDKSTSGLIIYAKTHDAAIKLNKNIKDHQLIKKYYLAWVEGKINNNQKIDGYIKIDEKQKRSFFSFNETKDSKFCSTVISIKNYDNKNNKTLIELELLTGRKHQIRALCSFLNHPIIGDKKYNSKFTGDLQLEAYKLIIDNKEYKIDAS